MGDNIFNLESLNTQGVHQWIELSIQFIEQYIKALPDCENQGDNFDEKQLTIFCLRRYTINNEIIFTHRILRRMIGFIVSDPKDEFFEHNINLLKNCEQKLISLQKDNLSHIDSIRHKLKELKTHQTTKTLK